MELKIDRDDERPVYRQIEEQILRQIKEESLQGGEKLPPERELAEKLGTARGTVKKAYEELERSGAVRSIHGKGTFILTEENRDSESRKERAVNIIGSMLNQMDNMNFSLAEIRNLVQVMIMERERKLQAFHIAFVDCNPEALSIFEKQILYVSKMNIHKYLLDEVLSMPDPPQVFGEFDLIITTTTHYAELAKLIPNRKDALIKAAVSPDRQTIGALTGIAPGAVTGVFCRSRRFYEIIQSWLLEFGASRDRIKFFPVQEENDSAAGDQDTSGLDWIVVSPGLPVHRFSRAHSRVITFKYMIQKGSLLHIEDRISAILDRQEDL